MDSLRIGFFYDSTQRDHEYTLLGLEDAYRRARSTSSQFRADVESSASRPPAAPDVAEEFTVFDAISLEPEFSRHPVLRDSLFLMDSAVDLAEFSWRGGELDELGAVERIAALDVRAWSAFSVLFNRDIPLLPAPLAPFRAAAPPRARKIAIVVNDLALGRRALGEIRETILRIEPEIAILEIQNAYHAPMRQSQWLAADLQAAVAHVHVGFPPNAVSFGRLIDTMNARAPCVVFESGRNPGDADRPMAWRRPDYQHDVNFIAADSIDALAEALRIVVTDRAWAQHLTRNALREVTLFREQIQNSLLPTRFVEVYATTGARLRA